MRDLGAGHQRLRGRAAGVDATAAHVAALDDGDRLVLGQAGDEGGGGLAGAEEDVIEGWGAFVGRESMPHGTGARSFEPSRCRNVCRGETNRGRRDRARRPRGGTLRLASAQSGGEIARR